MAEHGESLAEHMFEKEREDCSQHIEDGGDYRDHIFKSICIVLGLDIREELFKHNE